MNKKSSAFKFIILMICGISLLTSCESFNKQDETMGMNYRETIIPPPNTKRSEITETTVVLYEDEVNAMTLDLSFDDFLDISSDVLGITNPKTDSSNDDYQIYYYSDYNYYLRDEYMPDGRGGYISTPPEYEYHVEEAIFYNDLYLSVYRFDIEEWAENCFRSNLGLIQEEDILINHAADGYYFVKNEGSASYCLTYYVNDIVIVYRFSLVSGTSEKLETIWEIFDSVGLPKCDELSSEVL